MLLILPPNRFPHMLLTVSECLSLLLSKISVEPSEPAPSITMSAVTEKL
jgi:hypothetical protein